MISFFLALPGKVVQAGTIGLPFGAGERWTICRGYNVGNLATGDTFHLGVPVLDLSIAPNSAGSSGCIGDANESTNEEVMAPGDGTVYHISSVPGANDGVCLDLTNGGAVKIFHLSLVDRWPHGKPIQKDQILGRLAGPNAYNGNYAHIHIQAHENDCAGVLRPFTEVYGFRFEGSPDLPYDESVNQHSGLQLTKAAASTWHPNGTLIRAADDQTVYFLQGGKKRGIPSPDVLIANGWTEDDVIVVSPRERDCYPVGEVVSQTLLLPEWAGYRQGTLVRQLGTDPVYIVGEDGKLHWLQITEQEFYSYGYSSSMITDVAMNINPSDIGESIKSCQFKSCLNSGTGECHPWPMALANPQLTVRTEYAGPGALPLVLPPNSSFFPSLPLGIIVAKDGTIYVYTGEDPGIKAFDSNGNFKWAGKGEHTALDGDTLYTLECDTSNPVYDALFHIDTTTGTTKNMFRLPFFSGSCGYGRGPQGPFTFHQGTIYLLDRAAPFMLYAISAQDGSKKWGLASGYQWQPELYFDSRGALSPDGKTIYFVSECGLLYAVNTTDGTWKGKWQLYT